MYWCNHCKMEFEAKKLKEIPIKEKEAQNEDPLFHHPQ